MVRNLSTASASLRVITDIHLCWFNDVDDCAATLRWRNGLSGDDMKRCIETLMVLLRWSVWCLLPGAECLMMLRRDNAATEHVQKFREHGDGVAIKDSCSWRQAAARLGTRTTDRQIWCEKHDINWTTACQFQHREPWAGWLLCLLWCPCQLLKVTAAFLKSQRLLHIITSCASSLHWTKNNRR